MYTLMVVIFVLGYIGIALEHNIKVDKAASALITGALAWTFLVFGAESIFDIDYSWSVSEFISNAGGLGAELKHYLESLTMTHAHGESVSEITNSFIISELKHHLVEISEILFFLIGAMTIVEVIDTHDGFKIITDKIKTTKKIKLLWVLSIITFFMSATLDNLTASIVMATLLKKLIADKKDLWLFAGIIIIAANAGGAWSPIGDVTTIMLWIGGQVTALNIIKVLILPSMVTILVPLILLSFTLKGKIARPDSYGDKDKQLTTNKEKNSIFALGVLALVQVPIFKTVTNMPPFMGVLLGLGVLWLYTELLHRKKPTNIKSKLSVVYTLRRIDTPSVLFFLGILMAVAALQTAGHLIQVAHLLENKIGNMYIINLTIGLLSAIVDNVPLVAAAMVMYEVGPEGAGLLAYPTDHPFWEFLAYCAGTGGSVLIIGSAAGVAIMGILRIDFVWYIKKISLYALAGYFAGAGAFYVLINMVM